MLHIVRHHSRRIIIAICCVIALATPILVAMTDYQHDNTHRITSTDRPLALRPPVNHHRPAPKPTPRKTPTPSPTPAPITADVRMPVATDGLAPVVTSLPTKQPVVFLTIDDGAFKSPDELQMMNDNHVKATLFLAKLFIANDPTFFNNFLASGNLIEDHTLSHNTNMIRTMSYEQQKAEICGMADYEQQLYGRRPVLFRPPGGAYSETMQRAAAACGMKAVVTWIAKANGGSMQYQIGDHLRPGDVVLMHFRPEFKQDLQAFLDAMHSQHLQTELLENWMAE